LNGEFEIKGCYKLCREGIHVTDTFKDLFSKQAQDYAKFRPHYPAELYRYLASLARGHSLAWDCATGNGQAAVQLTQYFDHVIATDLSESQLKNATSHPKVEYRKAPAEESGLEAHSVELITVAQAFHWFNHERFFAEVRRVLKPKGVLALWSYNLAEFTPEVDRVVRHLHDDIVGPYWQPERQQVGEGYEHAVLPFEEIHPPRIDMRADWTFEHLVGYLGTWSALQSFIKDRGSNPLEGMMEELKAAWGEAKTHTARWKLALRIGRAA
jgi:ubiquinone/menaquinone biosynthesis C-methylase UbiE